jgi:hypothetical protein
MGHISLLLVVCAGIYGCGGARQQNQPPSFSQYADLPGLSKAADPLLQDEFARLRAEEATPAQLEVASATILADNDNLAAGLREVLKPNQIESALEDIDKIYPNGKFLFGTAAVIRARDLLAQNEAAVSNTSAALDRPKCNFGHRHGEGLFADLSVYETAYLAHRWQALEAAVALSEGNLAGAERSLDRMLRLAHHLAQVKHVVPRMKAVTMRLEALRVLEALVQHRDATPAMAEHFRDLLVSQLDTWPDDANAWVGDRAQGLHTYEMIRHGYLLSVLSSDELTEIRKEAGSTATAKAIAANVDEDQLYYLETMREIIDGCERPYHARRELLQKITRHLQETRSSPQFPLVAGRILLVDIDLGHRRQAMERAHVEGWVLTLSAATGEELPPLTTNPQTGLPYEVARESHRILVHHARAGEPDETIIAPRFDLK